MKTTNAFSVFSTLHRYFTLIETSKPTIQQAELAADQLHKIYGAESEEELLQRGDTELTEFYRDIKQKIMEAAN